MAGVAKAGGYVDYSSTSSSGYIPEVWSGKLVTKFYETTVFGSIASTEYEGEINGMGDNIIIRTIPDVTVSDYTIGSNFTAADYETPASAQVELAINKAKKFLVKVDTVQRQQSDIDLAEMFADNAAMRIKIAMDRDMLANIYSEASADNSGTTAGVISNDINLGVLGTEVGINNVNAVDFLLRMGQVLDEQNVSDEGRWVVLPSWYIKKLKTSDLKFAYLTGDNVTPLRNGRVGTVDRFTIYQSNLLNVDVNGSTNIIAGHSAGLAWASQIAELERLQNPWDFGHLMRGLCVYGYKVIEPKFLVHGVVGPVADA